MDSKENHSWLSKWLRGVFIWQNLQSVCFFLNKIVFLVYHVCRLVVFASPGNSSYCTTWVKTGDDRYQCFSEHFMMIMDGFDLTQFILKSLHAIVWSTKYKAGCTCNKWCFWSIYSLIKSQTSRLMTFVQFKYTMIIDVRVVVCNCVWEQCWWMIR